MSVGRALAALGVLLACAVTRGSAQVIPNAHWRTIDTKHFHIHFTPELEPAARRAAISAERAYAKLASQLTEPRVRSRWKTCVSSCVITSESQSS